VLEWIAYEFKLGWCVEDWFQLLENGSKCGGGMGKDYTPFTMTCTERERRKKRAEREYKMRKRERDMKLKVTSVVKKGIERRKREIC